MYAHHIIRVLAYASQNDWLNKQIKDILSMFHMEVEHFSKNGNLRQGFVNINSLLIEWVKKAPREQARKHMDGTFLEKISQ